MTPLTYALDLAAVLLTVAFALAGWRALRGPTGPDRFIAADLLAMVAVGFIAVWTLATGQSALLDAATILALVGFLGTLAVARRLEVTP